MPRSAVSDVMVPGAVHLDVSLHYARYYGQDVVYATSGVLAVGSPGFVAGMLAANMLANASARRQAEALARAQWRDFCLSRVVVTEWSTWCHTGFGQWLEFARDAVVEYEVEGWTAIVVFRNASPLMLTGPSVWLHAVVFARVRYGEDWQRAGWLSSLLAS